MYSSMQVNSMPAPAMPPSYCNPPVYGNIPNVNSYPFYPVNNSFYPPNGNIYPSPMYPVVNSQLPNYIPEEQVSMYSQPPPGYTADGQRVVPYPMNYQAMPNYNGYSNPYMNYVPNSTPNQFARPTLPPPIRSQPMKPNFSRNYNHARKIPEAKEKSLKKPWVNEALRVEIEKKFTLLEEAKSRNEQAVWDVYLEQKKKVEEMNQALRLEYIGNHPEEEFPYYCETCDRGFLTKNKYCEHVAEHTTCSNKDCTFSGHPKVVEKHYMMQHRTGLFNRIVKGNSPEEIEKWITERKKHFPTKQKIDEKRAQREEMEKRGERYREQRNQRISNFKSSGGSSNRFQKTSSTESRPKGRFNRTTNRNKNQGKDYSESQPRKPPPPPITDDDCIIRNLPPFRGTAQANDDVREEDCYSFMSTFSDNYSDTEEESIINEAHENVTAEIGMKRSILEGSVLDSKEDCLIKNFTFCDDTEEKTELCLREKSKIENVEVPSMQTEIENKEFKVETPQPISGLDLLKCYDYSDSENDEYEGESKNKSISKQVENNSKNNTDSEPEECSSKCPQNVENEDVSETNDNVEYDLDTMSNESKKRKRKRRRDSKDEVDTTNNDENHVEEERPQEFFKKRRYRRPTLLEKLLTPEIKHERNSILQCVRYVVENNFFNIGKQ